ncbi:MAG TPA: DUF5615 family PIN-like protein [Methylomirabilota bacterium]|nr:DUF5615 family PIN-like protein [Methylomirabilota bacterium]
MDVHVPRAITNGLRARGLDVLTAQTDGSTELADGLLLDRVRELGRVLFTRDDDLLREASARHHRQKPFASIIYAHQQMVSIGRCIADLELIAKAGSKEESSGHVFFLPIA